MSLQINGRGVLSLRAADTFLTHFQQMFAAFCVLMTEACCHFAPPMCILLFFLNLASKLQQLLITANATNTNQIQREFHSNVRIATFETDLASSHPPQKTNLFKLTCVTCATRALSPFLNALGKGLGDGGFILLRRYTQTKSKGNFCLITVYTHKNILQPQNTRAKKQTFSNAFLPSVSPLLCVRRLSFVLAEVLKC
jgi:hypothetical protein